MINQKASATSSSPAVCVNGISGEKDREVYFLGAFVKHTADKESQQSRRMLGERKESLGTPSGSALRWTIKATLWQQTFKVKNVIDFFLSVLFSDHQIPTFRSTTVSQPSCGKHCAVLTPWWKRLPCKVLTCSSGAMQRFQAKTPQDTSMLSQSQQMSYLRFRSCPRALWPAAEAGDLPNSHSTVGWSALSPEPQPPRRDGGKPC